MYEFRYQVILAVLVGVEPTSNPLEGPIITVIREDSI